MAWSMGKYGKEWEEAGWVAEQKRVVERDGSWILSFGE